MNANYCESHKKIFSCNLSCNRPGQPVWVLATKLDCQWVKYAIWANRQNSFVKSHELCDWVECFAIDSWLQPSYCSVNTLGFELIISTVLSDCFLEEGLMCTAAHSNQKRYARNWRTYQQMQPANNRNLYKGLNSGRNGKRLLRDNCILVHCKCTKDMPSKSPSRQRAKWKVHL